MADKTVKWLAFNPVPGTQAMGTEKGDYVAVCALANSFYITLLLTGAGGPNRSIIVAALGQSVPESAKYIGSAGGLVIFEV